MGEKLIKKLNEMGVKPSELTMDLINSNPRVIFKKGIFKGENSGEMRKCAVIKDITIQGYNLLGKYSFNPREENTPEENGIEGLNKKFGRKQIYSLNAQELTGLSLGELTYLDKNFTYFFVKDEILKEAGEFSFFASK